MSLDSYDIKPYSTPGKEYLSTPHKTGNRDFNPQHFVSQMTFKKEEAILFLASDESSFMKGTTVSADGSWSAR
jgi:hypothetical protein